MMYHIIVDYKLTLWSLTLQEGASGMDIKKGGAFNTRPYKNPLEEFLIQFFHTARMGGQKNLRKIFKIRILPKQYHYCILLASPAETHVLYQKFEKEIKTTQNVPKTVDNHLEQLVFGLG